MAQFSEGPQTELIGLTGLARTSPRHQELGRMKSKNTTSSVAGRKSAGCYLVFASGGQRHWDTWHGLIQEARTQRWMMKNEVIMDKFPIHAHVQVCTVISGWPWDSSNEIEPSPSGRVDEPAHRSTADPLLTLEDQVNSMATKLVRKDQKGYDINL